jgi:hypothetical protein
MGVFNRSFADLNSHRQYCLAVQIEDFPIGIIADLKLSLPSSAGLMYPCISGIYAKDDVLRIMISANGEPIFSFASDSRSSIRAERVYPLVCYLENAAGIITFGNGIANDIDYHPSDDLPAMISEECITRYVVSGIPYVSIACTSRKLTGEINIGTDSDTASTKSVAIPTSLYDRDVQGMLIDLVDSEKPDSDNPLVAFANGVNTYNDVVLPSPVFSLQGVTPNEEGTVFLFFGDHFKVNAVVDRIATGEEDEPEPTIVGCAVGSDITQEMVCGKEETKGNGEGEDQCEVAFVLKPIEYN